MEQENPYGQTFDFKAPDGNTYTIREQLGSDDDILSNPAKAKDFTNLSEFISQIVVGINNTSKRLTVNDAFKLPVNVRYGIMLASRIFSLGEDLVFQKLWEGDTIPVEYEINLKNFLFEDYHHTPEVSELEAKIDAIPYYPYTDDFKQTNIEVTISTGKTFMFDRFTGESEKNLVSLDQSNYTINRPLLARNLRYYMDNDWHPVTSFHMFTAREMKELRTTIYSYDPVFEGGFEINHPTDGRSERIILFGIKDFFYPGEA